MTIQIIDNYTINIFERYQDLKNSNKTEFNNNDLCKIFEYYSCIQLSKEYDKPFYEYNDISPEFKETNKMSRYDTGIDCCDLDKTIVQCKLREKYLSWQECGTFFGSQNIFNDELKQIIVRWKNLIIARNNDSKLSKNLSNKSDLFIDKPYDKKELVVFCENLLINKPVYPILNDKVILRDYQKECIEKIRQSGNIIVSLPTGTGKNIIIINSLKENKKYLILVPRIILMEQLHDEIIKFRPKLKSKIQLISGINNKFNVSKDIAICVFNSVNAIKDFSAFEKIYIDEAHHINTPIIYCCDTEDEDEDDEELQDTTTYIQIIKTLTKYNNNVYLSATIDKVTGFEYYNKDIREMIQFKYLCDYAIHIPIFSDDPNNKQICEHLLKNYRNIIIYCNSQKEGKIINELMNQLQGNSSAYVDCKTPKNMRNAIVNKYKSGEIPFLINVRILVEGFDAPITKGVCFLHLPQSRTTVIQIIGRALRLHPQKTIANIILPFSAMDDGKNICNFLQIIAKNDSRIRKSYEKRVFGGYISIDNVSNEGNNENAEFKYNMIYDSMGGLVNGEDVWIRKLGDVVVYFEKEEHELPFNHNLYGWLKKQKKNYKLKEGLMKCTNLREYWEEFARKYNDYILDTVDIWYRNFKNLKQYIADNECTPTLAAEEKGDRYLSTWLYSQKGHYKTVEYVMRKREIYDEWTKFMDEYKEYFLSNEEKFMMKLEELDKYVVDKQKMPTREDDDPKVVNLAQWIIYNDKNYKTKTNVMSIPKFYDIWTEVTLKYDKYITSLVRTWMVNFNKLKEYIIVNKRRPLITSTDENIRSLADWSLRQAANYRDNCGLIMNPELRILWGEFWEENQIYLTQYCQIFLHNLDKVKQYMIKHYKRPSNRNHDKKIRMLAHWLSEKITKFSNLEYVTKNKYIYGLWMEFVNSESFSQHFSDKIKINLLANNT